MQGLDEACGARAYVVGDDSRGNRVRAAAVIVLVTG
jgi:hypothetical protein